LYCSARFDLKPNDPIWPKPLIGRNITLDETQLRRRQMAKGQLRSNREKKKPKQSKAKPVGAVSQFSVAQPKPMTGSSSAKKQ
jgi:hypothetical protein